MQNVEVAPMLVGLDLDRLPEKRAPPNVARVAKEAPTRLQRRAADLQRLDAQQYISQRRLLEHEDRVAGQRARAAP
eukprot:853938-Alexandrium_andersonii.AAC.1